MGVATFAQDVSPDVAQAVARARDLLYAGNGDEAMRCVRSAAAAVVASAAGDDDRVALGEFALCVGLNERRPNPVGRFIEDLAARCQTPRARGALFFARARLWTGAEEFEFLRQALREFTVAGDERGRAVVLARMSWPIQGSVSTEHRLRVGREAVRLADLLGDPWLVAYCTGQLAGAKLYMNDISCLADYAKVAGQLVAHPDLQTAHIAYLNQLNWGLSAFAFGRYDEARQVFSEGRATAFGELWENRFDGGLAMVAWRTGRPQKMASPGGVGRELAILADAAVELETARNPDAVLTHDVVVDVGNSIQLRWLAGALQARLRVVRREPDPLRGLADLADEVVSMGARVGWDEPVLVLAEQDAGRARAVLEQVDGLWADHPRASAARQACEALVAGSSGYPALVAAARVFEGLPEPVTAGRLLHRAAKVAPTINEANALRRRAIELFRSAGADRSMAAVLRERALHRGEGLPRIPEQLVGTASGGLTAREREIAALAACGLTAQEIANELSISVWTTRHHLQRVRAKFGGVPKRRLGAMLAGELVSEA